jgi:hypothetical protein
VDLWGDLERLIGINAGVLILRQYFHRAKLGEAQ